jgi:hypothetical protein
MSHLAVSDSTVDRPDQSGPCPGHTFKKTAAINAVIAKVPDNAFCHLLAFRLKRRSDFKENFWHLVRKQTQPARFHRCAKCHVVADESGARRSQFLYPLAYDLKKRDVWCLGRPPYERSYLQFSKEA